jgi:hypothetical protein
VGILCTATCHPLSAKLALTSPTSIGRSVGIVHSQTKATEFVSLSSCYNVCGQYIVCSKLLRWAVYIPVLSWWGEVCVPGEWLTKPLQYAQVYMLKITAPLFVAALLRIQRPICEEQTGSSKTGIEFKYLSKAGKEMFWFYGISEQNPTMDPVLIQFSMVCSLPVCFSEDPFWDWRR